MSAGQTSRCRKRRPYTRPAFEIYRADVVQAKEPRRLQTIAANLLARVFHHPQKEWLEQLALVIVEYGRMNAPGPGDILIEVPEVAYRLREPPRNVRQAVELLAKTGIAKRTNSKDYWKLRQL